MLWRKDFGFEPQAPGLLQLCADAQVEQSTVTGLENSLFQQLGYQTEQGIPFAWYRYQLDFGVPPSVPLLCADPVCLQSGISQVLLEARVPRITSLDLQLLLGKLNQHLAQDGLELVAKHPQRWYLLKNNARIQLPEHTVPLTQAWGQDIYPLLPQGENRYWHRLINEMQMLLHDSGVDAVNGVWLWGGVNKLPPAEITQTSTDMAVAGQTVNAQTVAGAAGVACQAAAHLREVRAAATTIVVLEDLMSAALKDETHCWQQLLDRLEDQWLMPAWTDLKAGLLDVSLHPCDGRIFHCQMPGRWKFWQKRSIRWQDLETPPFQ